MNDKKPDIRQLDYAIASLNDDAENIHTLITRSTDELERATAEGRRSADIADGALKMLAPLTEELKGSVENVDKLVKETGDIAKKLTTDFEQAQEAGKAAFESFTSASLKAAEKTRDDFQTDLLSHKTAMAARMDSLEATTTRHLDGLESAITNLSKRAEELEKSFDEKADSLGKKVSLPLYGVIAVAVLQALTIIALFMK